MPAGPLPLDFDAAPWRNAPDIQPFLRAEDGRPVRLATRARLVWDDTALHALFECEDDHIWGTFTRHNERIYDEEVVEVFLDPQALRTRYYEFELSPRNVRFAAQISNDASPKPKVAIERFLDPEAMRSAVHVVGALGGQPGPDRLWRAAFSMPFALIGRPTPVHGEQWRANLYRIDRGPQGEEYGCWSPTFTQPAYFHHPEHFGILEFVHSSH